MAQQGELLVAGSNYLFGGSDSYTNPIALPDSEIIESMNTVNRGGRYRTRPGTRIMGNLEGDNLQGCTMFLPSNGAAALVVAIDGKVYVANQPFRDFVQLTDIQFNPTSPFVSWALCEQSSDYTVDGQFYFLETPKTVLIMQDGVTRAAYWDGVTHGHIDPTPSSGATTEVGKDGTRIGLWMAWSNNRLWVSRNNQVFASDLGNPLKFTETTYLNEGRAFYLSGNCTGIIETPDKDGILVFTDRDGTLLLSSIQDREQWLSTPDFQKTVLPSSGCIAPRSLINQYGLTWWFSSTGLQNLNSALNQNISSVINYQDLEMTGSKQNISADMSVVCSGFYENYMVVSVPSGDRWNRHTWCLDHNPLEGDSNIWPSYWTGWRPVEWTRGVVGGRERVFFVSRDYDGVNRVWEAFIADHQDNGCAITCFVRTKQHMFPGASPTLYRKRFETARLFLSNLWGNVSLKWWVLPQNGAPMQIGTKEIVATSGQVYDDQSYGGSNSGFDNEFRANRPQTRTVWSENDPEDTDSCTTCGIEKEDSGPLDWAFGLMVVWSGDMSVDGYQLFARADDERISGRCEENEQAPRSVNYYGCGAEELFPDGNPFGPTYSATDMYCADDSCDSSSSDSDSSGSSSDSSSSSSCQVCATATRESIISQDNADRLAACAARFDAEFQAGIRL